MTTHDRIELRGISVFAYHGVLEHERVHGQEFLVDLVLEVDTRRAAETDQLSDTANYGDLALKVAQEMRRDPVNLIETLAHRIARVVLADTHVDAVEVTVHKPYAPIETEFSDVSVTIRRTTEDVT